MKKMNNRGFMLTETLIVAVFTVTTLVFLYSQFRNINRSYETSFKYNNAENLYALGNINKYIKANGYETIINVVSLSSEKYIDITSCASVFLSETNYCLALEDALGIKQLLLTTHNLDLLKQQLSELPNTTEEMKRFINVISYDKNGTGYRLIAEFENGTFATLDLV